jgi:hypothetical protein
MQPIKIVGAGASALLAIGSLINLIGKMKGGTGTAAATTNTGLNSPIVSILGLVIFGILAVVLWRSATTRPTPRR